MTRFYALIGPLVLLALLFPAAGGVLAQSGQGAGSSGDAEATRALIGDVLSQSEYQTDLPGAETEAGRLVWRPGDRAMGGARTIPVPAGTGAVLELLAWLALGIVVVLLVGALARGVLERRWVGSGTERGRKGSGEAGGGGRDRPVGWPELPEADRLAAAGRFGEAVHVLLIRALAKLSEGRGRSFADSATSREILRWKGLAPGERPPLGRLVEAVERSLFGGTEVDAEEYEDCRRAYGALEKSP